MEAGRNEKQHPGRIPVADDSSASDASDSDHYRSKQSVPSLCLSMITPSGAAATSNANANAAATDDNDDDDDDDGVLMLLRSPTDEEFPSVFEDFDFELPLRWYKRMWSVVLCIAGIFDILAYSEPTLRSNYNRICAGAAGAGAAASDTDTSGTPVFGGNLSNLLLEELDLGEDRVSVPWYCSRWSTFLSRLRDYNVVIAFVFSLLWFMHSQIKAREEYYHKFTVEEDRLQLLSSSDDGDGNDDGDGYGYGDYQNEREIREKNGKATTKRKKNNFNAQHHYYRRLLTKMLLLPVGFYFIIFHFVRGLMDGEWLYRELLINPTNQTVFLTVQDPKDQITIEISESHAKMSTIFAIFIYLKHHFLLTTTLSLNDLQNSAIPMLKRKLVKNAIRNPRECLRQVRKILKYVRWVKYSLPLAGGLNKLRGNALATLRKKRLYEVKKLQTMLRKRQQERESKCEDEELAATLIQRIWRSHRKHLYQRVAVHFVNDVRVAAAMKIQMAYRRNSIKARIQVMRKRKELARLERLKRQTSTTMNDKERRRLYELQDEFTAEAKKIINKRLLMRPNTKFAVAWNSIFMFCILVEISRSALKPWLLIPKAKRVGNRKYGSMRLFLAKSLIPDPVAETPACKGIFKRQSALQRLFYRRQHVEQPTRQEVVRAFIDEITNPDYGLEGIENHTNHTNHISSPNIPWRCSEPLSTWQDGFRDIVSLACRPNPVWDWPACREEEVSIFGKIISPFRKKRTLSFPWYCSKPYSTLHNWYRSTWNFILDEIYVVISIICFYDVFVKFFTGEIDPITGELKPKPFVRRWIFPGLLLQLLVNPAIEGFSVLFFRITDFVMVIGPVRVLRWCIAVVVPVLYASRNLVIHALHEDKQLANYATMLAEYSR